MGDIIPFRPAKIHKQTTMAQQPLRPLIIQDALTCSACEGQVFIVQVGGTITCRDCFTISNNFECVSLDSLRARIPSRSREHGHQ